MYISAKKLVGVLLIHFIVYHHQTSRGLSVFLKEAARHRQQTLVHRIDDGIGTTQTASDCEQGAIVATDLNMTLTDATKEKVVVRMS